MDNSEVPGYVKLLDELPENVLIAMGEENKSDEVAILLPWAADLLSAHAMALREAYGEGDFVTAAQLIPAIQDVFGHLSEMLGLILVNFLTETGREISLIQEWVQDVEHYNSVTVERSQANLMSMGWGAEHAKLNPPEGDEG